jgi:hypothetical protein
MTPKAAGPAEGSTAQSSFSAPEDQADPHARAGRGSADQALTEQAPGSQQASFGSLSALAPGAPAVANSNGTGRGATEAPDLSPVRASSELTAVEVTAAETTANAPAATTAPPHEMLLRIASPSAMNGGSGGNVDIRVTGRGGDVQVTVHTPDAALQANLRQDLPDLVNALDRAGFEAHTFVPRTTAATASGSSFEQDAGGNQADSPNSGGTPDSRSGNAKDSGQFTGQQSFEQQHQSRDRQAQHWLEQIEE